MRTTAIRIGRSAAIVSICVAVFLSTKLDSGLMQETAETPGATFTVTSTSDSGPGTLRQAITDANAAAGTDTIEFQIGTGPVSINVPSDLPVITEPVVLDGTTQPGFSGEPLITIFLSGFITPQGLKITGGGSTIKAIAVTNAMTAITLENDGGNVITGCYIGTCPETPFCGNAANGILINNSPNNQIGGASAAERNVIGGNTNDGIRITGDASSGNIIIGNFIGIGANGANARNVDSGIAIIGAPNNRVGGTTSGERNVITNNSQVCDLPGTESNSGVLILGAAAVGNVIEGNYIGTTINGMSAPPGFHQCNRIRIEDAPNNRVGGTVGTTPGGACTGACNVISGVQDQGGVQITGSGATGNSVWGNFIGTNAAGTAGLYNDTGVQITDGASNNTVGGTIAAERNLITNGLLLIGGATGNTVQGNYIGTDTTGTVGIGTGTLFPNILVAVGIDSPMNTIGTATGTTLGGACTGGCNLISGNNASHGVFITGSGSAGNRVDYNYIGLNVTGTVALRNGGDAIVLRDGANNNIIGRPPGYFYQSTVTAPASTYLIQDDQTGNFIQYDINTRSYTVKDCRGNVISAGTVAPEDVIQDGTMISFSDSVFAVQSGFKIEASFDTISRKGRGSLRQFSEIGSTTYQTTLYFDDDNISNHVGDCPTECMQTVLGDVSSGIPGDSNPPHNNIVNFNSLGSDTTGIITLSTSTADGYVRHRAGNFFTYSNIFINTNGGIFPPISIGNGTDNFITGLNTYAIDPGNFLFQPVELGPGANRDIPPPQDLAVFQTLGGGAQVLGVFNGTPNTNYRISISGFNRTTLSSGAVITQVNPTGTAFLIRTDENGSYFLNEFYSGVDAFSLLGSEKVAAVITQINAVPITSESGNSSFVDVPGDTSEFSFPAVVPQPKFDFDNDGKTDIAVYRPGAAADAPSQWYVLYSSNSGVVSQQFGVGEDKIVPVDYHGDGVADFGVFRPSSGTWYHSMRNGDPATSFVATQWGSPTDVPVPGDYFDIGSSTQAVFRPSDGVWYIRNPFDGSLLAQQWGISTDKTVPADYNGDGRTDVAVFRDGVWYISVCTSCPLQVAHFGISSDVPVPGDYDGDGTDDIAVWRPSTGVWYVQRSSAGFTAVQWGASGDKVLNGDFDADGKNDMAVWRPSSGIWYILRSEAGFLAIQWGQNGDIPAAAFPNQ